MKELLSLFTIVFSTFKIIKKFFDSAKLDYYFSVLFQIILATIFALFLFRIDFYFFTNLIKNEYLNSLCLILLIIELITIISTVIIYSAIYSFAINHFILYKDKNNVLFERLSFTNPFNKEHIKVNSETDLYLRKYKKNKYYEYIDAYKIESFKFIDKESKVYEEYSTQIIKNPIKRLFAAKLIRKRYSLGMPIIYIISILLNRLFKYWTIDNLAIHILLITLFLGFLIKIGESLLSQNVEDKLKVIKHIKKST